MTDKPDVQRCAACGTEKPVSEMKTCMHAQMHRYVCDMKCMNDFYNPPPKQALEPEGSYQKGYDEGTEHRVAEIQQLEASRAADKARIERLEEALRDIAGKHHYSASAGEYFAEVARAALAQQGKDGEPRNPNSGHGHVWRRPDGFLARCGGPGICPECSRDLAQQVK